MHVILRVGLDAVGRIASVEWQQFDRSDNRFVGEAAVVPTLQVVDEIMRGGRVVMAERNGYVQGAEVTAIHDESGREWIRLNRDGAPGLHDLPHLP